MIISANKIIMNFKKLNPNATTPKRQHSSDAGYDLTAVTLEQLPNNKNLYKYGTGLAFEIPKGHVGLLFPRSSVYKKDISLRNCVGVIDSGYRGEVSAIFHSLGDNPELYAIGERCIQLLILPISTPELVEVDELQETDRGAGGYGSTGNGKR